MLKYTIVGGFIDLIRMGIIRKKWHKLHPGSDTIPMNQFNFENVEIGKGTYGELNVVDYGGDCRLIIKNFVSIAQNVTFLLNAEHFVNHISTYPYKTKALKIQKSESFGKGNIIVDDDVWIGYGATIMSGVHIGKGAVIAACAVVTKDVEPYTIVGGVPARFIKDRFEPSEKEFIGNINFELLNNKLIKQNLDYLYKDVSDLDLKEILEKFRESDF